MKLLPKKFIKAKPASKDSLDEVQKEFNITLFNLGDANLRKHILSQELKKLDSEINSHYQKLDQLGKDAQSLSKRLREQEVLNKIEEGKKNAQEANPVSN